MASWPRPPFPAVLISAPGILRRRRSRHPDRRAALERRRRCLLSATIIVHNRLSSTAAPDWRHFVAELDEVPDDRPVVFSAHGVPKSVPAAASERGLHYVDATCPLVSKVHRQAERLIAEGRHILFIGHAGHPEVIGTFGQVPEGSITLVETEADVANVTVADADSRLSHPDRPSVDDTAAIVALEARFPRSRPAQRGLCYAPPPPGAVSDRAVVRETLCLRSNSRNSLRLRKSPTHRLSARLIGTGEPHRLGRLVSRKRSASPPAPRRPSCWCAKLSRSPRALRVTAEEADHSPERLSFKLPRELVA